MAHQRQQRFGADSGSSFGESLAERVAAMEDEAKQHEQDQLIFQGQWCPSFLPDASRSPVPTR